MLNFFKKPFPSISGLWPRILSASMVGLFIFLFLFVFQPFGIATIRGPILLVTLGYGIITFFTMLIVQVGGVASFPAYYNEDKWTIGRELGHTMLIVLLVAIGNLLYSVYLGFFSLSFTVFLLFLGFTLLVGIFPVLIQVLIRQNIHQRQNLKISEGLSRGLESKSKTEAKQEWLELTNEEGQTELRLEKSALLFLESADNYVEAHYLEGGELKRQLIRNTLKHFEEKWEKDQELFRCHRSYLVNLGLLLKVNGNARGYLLCLHEALQEIPVSRRKIEEFQSRMQLVLGSTVDH